MAKTKGQAAIQAEEMVPPKQIDVTPFIDQEGGIYVGVRVTRELHGVLMDEKRRRGDRPGIGELVAESIVARFVENRQSSES